MNTEWNVCALLADKMTTFDCVVFILAGGAAVAYGLLAKTFREDGRLRMLTPVDQLERYVPRWYQRLPIVVVGVVLFVLGILGLCGIVD